MAVKPERAPDAPVALPRWLGWTAHFLPRKLQLLLVRQDVRFLIVGGLNTLFGLLAFYFYDWLGLHYTLANLAAMVTAVAWNSQTTGRLVFDGIDRRKAIKFFGLYVLLYGWGVLGLRVGELLGWTPRLTATILFVPNTALAYLLNKYFVFRA